MELSEDIDACGLPFEEHLSRRRNLDFEPTFSMEWETGLFAARTDSAWTSDEVSLFIDSAQGSEQFFVTKRRSAIDHDD